MKLLAGKVGVVMGVLNEYSIAYGIAKTAAEHGADLWFTCPPALVERVAPVVEKLGFHNRLLACDVASDDSISAAFSEISNGGKNLLDFLVHAIAYSDKNELKGRYVETSRTNFGVTMDISAYSFAAVCKALEPHLKPGASLITLTYEGSRRVIRNYNVMGVAKAALEASVRYLAYDFGQSNKIRVNAISAGPIKTLAASGISGFRDMLKVTEKNNPLCRNTTLEDVGGAAVFLLSDLASGVTGEVIHVDCGSHIVGMVDPAMAE